MNKIKFSAFIAFLFIFQFAVFSQELSLGFETGLGSYSMNHLKVTNGAALKALPFNAKITVNFPMYFYYKPSLIFSYKNVNFGFVWSFQSTGSRISRTDFSGEYYYDNKIRASSPGILIEFKSSYTKFNLIFSNEIGMENSILDAKEFLRIDTITQAQGESLDSRNYYYEPSLKISIPLSAFRVGLVVGYQIDFKLGYLSGSGWHVINALAMDERTTANWRGIRLGLSVSVDLFNKLKSGEKNP
jgi:hypothetical protein